MKIRSFELNNFRKFRAPIRLDGFTDGLNIVVEPNETGKSTLLDAMRAALFERHTAKNELTRSYCPWDDDVAPSVSMKFGYGEHEWHVEKQFLKGQFARLSGGGNRYEGEAAEERLQSLLGFERGGNRGSDLDTRGTLGLLWVEQCGGLDLSGPGKVARDTIRNVLESEVGAVTGGRRFAVVSKAVTTALAQYRSATGKPRDKLQAAETALTAATARRAAAEVTLRGFETALTQLERAHGDLRRLEVEINDPTRDETRKQLVDDLAVARGAQERLRTEEATRDALRAKRQVLEAATMARATAMAEMKTATAALEQLQSADTEHADIVQSALDAETRARDALAKRRGLAAEAETARGTALAARDTANRSAALGRALDRLDIVTAIETDLVQASAMMVAGIDDKVIANLVKLDAERARRQTIVEAGSVGLQIDLVDEGAGAVRIDGKGAVSGRRDVFRATDIEITGIGWLRIMPPTGSDVSAAAAHATAEQMLGDALAVIGAVSVSAARDILEGSKAGAAEVKRLQQRLNDVCAADPVLGIGQGADALKAALHGKIRPEVSAGDGDTPDHIDALDLQLQSQRAEAERASTAHAGAMAALAKVNERRAGLAADLVTAGARVDRARAVLPDTNESDDDSLAARLQAAIEDEARQTGLLDTAVRAASAFDVEALLRKQAAAEQRARTEVTERIRLSSLIGGLEASVRAEGSGGPAGAFEEAGEEEEAAGVLLQRLTQEANSLSLLSSVLDEAASAAARQFVEPVTRRAAHYVQRLLPGAALGLSKDMMVDGIDRLGRREQGTALSRGTQEQLAVLTRLAFADLLIAKGLPVSIVLDDALVYSDDDRLEIMTDILSEAAARMQIILLTCRTKAFRHVQANVLSLS